MEGKAVEQRHGAQELDVSRLPVLLNVHEDVDEVFTTHHQQLDLVERRHCRSARRLVHDRVFLSATLTTADS